MSLVRFPLHCRTEKNSLVLGEENQTKLAGNPVKGPLFEFAPAIDVFLKAHLFGDIFARDNLDWLSREIATIAALANMEGLDSQLQAHLRMGANTGLTPAQLRGIIAALKQRVNLESGHRAELAFKCVFPEKK
ncbi:MAG: carboxymuconolactone decarboxylase family protein [Alistipes senegalensis]|nr:carboxymuconolactone decarboxylase family protein [Oxalobacter formigenes]MCM1281039.1 carboxymuconolactone decarboxylase family protein [Alistipes senegalensis]